MDVSNPFKLNHIKNMLRSDFDTVGPCVVMAAPGFMQVGDACSTLFTLHFVLQIRTLMVMMMITIAVIIMIIMIIVIIIIIIIIIIIMIIIIVIIIKIYHILRLELVDICSRDGAMMKETV